MSSVENTLELAKFWRLQQSVGELVKFFGEGRTLGEVAQLIKERKEAFLEGAVNEDTGNRGRKVVRQADNRRIGSESATAD